MLQVSIFVRIVLVTEWALAFSQATPTRHVNRTMPWTLPERDVCEDCPRSICLSLLVEPKRAVDTPPSSDMRQLFQWATRSQAQTSTSSASS